MTYNLHKHREIQEAQTDNVELIKVGKDASIRFESPEVTFNFIAIFVAFGVMTPWVFDGSTIKANMYGPCNINLFPCKMLKNFL